MSIENIVDLTITIANPVITRAGFGTALILSAEANGKFSGQSKLYGSADELLDDSFSASGITYRLAQKLTGQNPAPSQFIVAKRTNSADFTHSVDVTVLPGQTGDEYSIDINSTTYSYTRPDGYSDAEVATELADLISADLNLDVSTIDEVITVDAVSEGVINKFESPVFVSLTDNTSVTDGYTTQDLAAALDYNQDFYAVLLDLNSKDQVKEVAAWIESKRRVLFYDTADFGCLDQGVADDIFSELKDLSYANTIGMYHHEIGSGAAAGWLGGGITYEPGVYNWCHKVISGVSTSPLSDSQTAAIRAKRGNYYVDVAGSGGTWNGITPSGEFIDTISLVHFLYARITEDVIAAFKANVRIPYTNQGVAVITGTVGARLRSKIGSGIAADPAPQVTAPRVADINAADKQARHLPDVKFVALLEGAINSVSIRGTVSVDEAAFQGIA